MYAISGTKPTKNCGIPLRWNNTFLVKKINTKWKILFKHMKSQYFKVIIFTNLYKKAIVFQTTPPKCVSMFAKWFYDFYNEDTSEENNKVKELFCQMS